MRLDQFSNPVFNEQDIFEALYKAQTLSPVMMAEPSVEVSNLEEVIGFKFSEPYPADLEVPLPEYDAICQQHWFMPDEYKTLDIENWVLTQCDSQRVRDELEAYKARNMLDLLRWLKYFVDVCSKEEILWGLGRGSSVASYVLYIIGVHNIDSVKYNLDWQEFLR